MSILNGAQAAVRAELAEFSDDVSDGNGNAHSGAAEKNIAAEREVTELRRTVERQARYLDALEVLAGWAERMSSREDELRAAIYATRDQILYAQQIAPLQIEIARLQRRIEELTIEKAAAEREAAELRRTVERQAHYLDALEVLAGRVERMSSREDELRAAVYESRDQIVKREDELRAKLDETRNQLLPHLDEIQVIMNHYKHFQYQQLIYRIREIVRSVLPPEATVIVLSKGDDELLKLGGPQAWHFPQNVDGTYAGYYPDTSSAAIAALEALRAKGARTLLFPNTAFWWLDHYGEFREHLDAQYRRIWNDEHCIIYQLETPELEAV